MLIVYIKTRLLRPLFAGLPSIKSEAVAGLLFLLLSSSCLAQFSELYDRVSIAHGGSKSTSAVQLPYSLRGSGSDAPRLQRRMCRLPAMAC